MRRLLFGNPCSGRPRVAKHAPAQFIRAFRRMALILRGLALYPQEIGHPRFLARLP